MGAAVKAAPATVRHEEYDLLAAFLARREAAGLRPAPKPRLGAPKRRPSPLAKLFGRRGTKPAPAAGPGGGKLELTEADLEAFQREHPDAEFAIIIYQPPLMRMCWASPAYAKKLSHLWGFDRASQGTREWDGGTPAAGDGPAGCGAGALDGWSTSYPFQGPLAPGEPGREYPEPNSACAVPVGQPGEGGAALGDADIDMTAFGRDVSRLINRNINGEAVSPFLLWEAMGTDAPRHPQTRSSRSAR